MDYTDKFEPKTVLKHFKNICEIPHISGHEQALCSYIKDFARKCGHEYFEDETGNLIVYVKASPGCEGVPPFLMQAHMDMVPAKEETSDHDFLKDPIRTHLVDGRYLYADGTTLGADNAVGMMNMLALMEDDTAVHPPLEMLFTVTEETGLTGIRYVDFSRIKSRRMMNMDCGDPETLCVSTAGAAVCLIELPISREKLDDRLRLMEIKISGLLGGHGGLMIDCGRMSAVLALGRILCSLSEKVDFNLVGTGLERLSGIAPEMSAVIALREEDLEAAASAVSQAGRAIYEEYKEPEENLSVTFEGLDRKTPEEYSGKSPDTMLDKKSSRALERILYLMPFGVTKRDWQEKETVMCSNNTVEIILKEDCFQLETMVRSPYDAVKDELVARMKLLMQLCGAKLTVKDSFSGWPYRKESPLRELCFAAYQEMTGKTLKTEKENACAETGIILGAVPDMDCIAIAPLSKGAHTPKEYLDLCSVKPFWDFLLLLLEKMCREKA